MPHPSISVIIATYNRADLLKKCLSSFLDQTLSTDHFEMILIDDGSNDKTKQIFRQMASNLPLKSFKQNHTGLSAARNLGLFAAEGEILLFFDDDDLADKNLLGIHLNLHRKYPDLNTAVLGYTDWLPTLRITPIMYYITHIGQHLFSYLSLDNEMILDFSYFWGGRSSCKKEFLIKHEIFNPLTTWDDFELGYRLSNHGLKVLFCPGAVSYMNREVTYHEFCKRCHRIGKEKFRVSKMHPNLKIPGSWGIQEAAKKWENAKRILEARTKQVTLLEEEYKNSLPNVSAAIVLKLFNLYEWSFQSFYLKGYIEEMNQQKGTAHAVPYRKIPKKDLDYIWRKKKSHKYPRALSLSTSSKVSTGEYSSS